MPRRGDRDHYDRPSWAELDKRRGKKKGPPEPKPDRPENRWAQKARDEKFDLLFMDPKKELARKKIVEHAGKDTFVAAVDEYRTEWGLPEDFDILQLIFENHKDVAVRAEALEKMDTMVDATADSTKQVFKTRIKLLKMSAREPELKKIASRIAKTRGY